MIRIAKHDYVELIYVYAGAIIIVLLLTLTAFPLDVPKFGLLVPQAKLKSSIYSTEAFKEVSVEAESYAVYDLVNKTMIASKNADVVLPLASITKLMTALTALSYYDEETEITIRPESIEGGYDLGLKKGQTWNLDELLKYTLVFSSNDGAHAIADNLGGRGEFVKKMNEQSALLGLSLTFTDPAGLDYGATIGGVGTAADTAKLFGVLRKLYPNIAEATTKTRVTTTASNGPISGIPNTNQSITSFFGAEVSKTGFTDSAGGNLGVIVDIALGHPVAIVVLGSTREARFSDVETLYTALLKSVK